MSRWSKLKQSLNTKSLSQAVNKLRKASEAGEAVGKQTGVDSRSWEQLVEAAKRLKTPTAAVGAASLGLTSDEAEAAGIQTIMKQLGVGLEEAKKIKEMAAMKLPEGVFEDNIRAIQAVSQYKKDPESLMKLGSGADFQTLIAKDKVLKVPRSTWSGATEESAIAPSLVESVGLGPQTKTIQLGNTNYFIQEPLTPIEKLQGDIYYRRRQDPSILALEDQRSRILANMSDDSEKKWKAVDDLTVEIAKAHQDWNRKNYPVNISELEKQYQITSMPEIYKIYNIDDLTDISATPDRAVTAQMNVDARNKLSDVIKVRDVHEGNIGLDKASKPLIYDTSRFSHYKPQGLTPEMRQKILENYIALPEQKKELTTKLDKGFQPETPEFRIPDYNTDSGISLKKVASVAGGLGLGSLGLSGEQAEAGGIDKIKKIADQYAKARGLSELTHNIEPSKINVDRAKKIAQAFNEMKHDPTNPDVKKAYDALIKETADQYKALKAAGLKTEKIKPGMENPYKSSDDLFKDLTENEHMWYYPTEQGFGSGNISDHPLQQMVEIDGEQIPANDLFRIVHDYFGHAKEGYKFGSKGEEAAWRAHMQMFSPEAQKALTTETRGQNSWVNYGPYGEANRANPAQTRYADQKAGLLPDWAYDTKAGLAMPAAGSTFIDQPLKNVSDFYQTIRKPIVETSGEVGRSIANLTNPAKSIMSPEQKQELEDLGSGLGQIVLDPANLASGGAGLGLMLGDVLTSQEEPQRFPSLQNRLK